MRALHKMLIANIRDDIAGRFRASGEYVRVGSHIAPAPEEIVGRLERMLVAYHASQHESIIKRVARLHLAFERTAVGERVTRNSRSQHRIQGRSSQAPYHPHCTSDQPVGG
jgi:hypothetical protein